MKNQVLIFLIGIILFPMLSLKESTKTNLLERFSKQMLQRRYKGIIEVYLYSDKEKSKLIEKQNFEISCFGVWMKFKTKELEYYANDRYIVMLDSDQRQIIMAPTNHAVQEQILNQFEGILKTGNKNLELSETKGSSEVQSILKLHFKKEINSVADVELTINNKTLEPQKISFLYNKSLNELFPSPEFIKEKQSSSKPLVEIVYHDFTYINQLNKQWFDFSHIVTFNKKGIAVLTKQFSDFELINTVNETY